MTPFQGNSLSSDKGRVVLIVVSSERAILSEIGCFDEREMLYMRASFVLFDQMGEKMPSTERVFSVRVPVLSKTIACTCASFSRLSAFFMSKPRRAPAPTPVMMAVGVANPREQGHAITSTAIVLETAKAILFDQPSVGGQKISQATRVIRARTITTYTKIPEILSAIFSMGAFEF